MAWGLQNKVAQQSPVSWDTGKFSPGLQHPPRNIGRGREAPGVRRPAKRDEVNACSFPKGILKEATNEVLGETLGFPRGDRAEKQDSLTPLALR